MEGDPPGDRLRAQQPGEGITPRGGMKVQQLRAVAASQPGDLCGPAFGENGKEVVVAAQRIPVCFGTTGNYLRRGDALAAQRGGQAEDMVHRSTVLEAAQH